MSDERFEHLLTRNRTTWDARRSSFKQIHDLTRRGLDFISSEEALIFWSAAFFQKYWKLADSLCEERVGDDYHKIDFCWNVESDAIVRGQGLIDWGDAADQKGYREIIGTFSADSSYLTVGICATKVRGIVAVPAQMTESRTIKMVVVKNAISPMYVFQLNRRRWCLIHTSKRAITA